PPTRLSRSQACSTSATPTVRCAPTLSPRLSQMCGPSETASETNPCESSRRRRQSSGEKKQMSLSPEFHGTLTRKSAWKPLFTSILAPLAVVLLIACGSGPVARSHNSPSPSASPSPSPSPTLALTNFTVAPARGGGLTGSGTADRSRAPVAHTASVGSLTPGRTYPTD